MLWWSLRKLRSADEKRQLEAIRELEGVSKPAVLDGFRDCLRRWDSRSVRLAAVNALSKQESSKILGDIVSALNVEADGEVVRAEIDLLFHAGWFGVPQNLESNSAIIGKAEQYGNVEVQKTASAVRTALVLRARERASRQTEEKHRLEDGGRERFETGLRKLMTSLTVDLRRIERLWARI